MTVIFPEPMDPIGTRSEVFLAYLDFFRSRVIETVEELPEEELRRSRLPSGWSPLELVKHLAYMERRWIEWGFEGNQLEDPSGDRKDGRWHVTAAESRPELLAALRKRGDYTRNAVRANDLSQVGQPGPRWAGKDPATLERVLFHMMQEYARHLGHLDIVTELATGAAGE